MNILARPGKPCKWLSLAAGPLDRAYLISMVAMPSTSSGSPRLILGRAFLDRLGSAIDQVLGFLQASDVTSRTALMVLILFAPKSFRITWNSVCSSTAGAAAPQPPPQPEPQPPPKPQAALPAFSPERRFQQAQGHNLLFQLHQIRHFLLQSETFEICYSGRKPNRKFPMRQTRALSGCTCDQIP